MKFRYFSTLLAAVCTASAAPPSNDNFADTVVVSKVPAVITGTTVGATMEPNEPNMNDRSSSVWYEWTAPAAGILVVRITECTNWTICDVFYSGNALTNLESAYQFAFSSF